MHSFVRRLLIVELRPTSLVIAALVLFAAGRAAVAQEPSPPAEGAPEKPTTYFDLRISKDLLSRQTADRYFNLVKLQEWSSDKGTKIMAKYVSHAEDLQSVTLAVARGSGAARVMKEVTVPTNRLSKTCQSRVKQISTLQNKLDDLLAKAAEEPADPNNPGYVPPDRGEPMTDENGAQPRTRRVRRPPRVAPVEQPAATPQAPPAAAPSATVSPSADDGSADPLGFGELPAAPPPAAAGASGSSPPLPVVIAPPADPSPEGLVSSFSTTSDSGAAPPTAGPPRAWQTDYAAFNANFTKGQDPSNPLNVDFGELTDLKEVADGVRVLYERSKHPPEELKRTAAAVVAAKKRMSQTPVHWTGIIKRIGKGGQAAGQVKIIEFDFPPLPEPLDLQFQADKEDPQFAKWDEFSEGQSIRFKGIVQMMNDKTVLVQIREPEPVRDR